MGIFMSNFCASSPPSPTAFKMHVLAISKGARTRVPIVQSSPANATRPVGDVPRRSWRKRLAMTQGQTQGRFQTVVMTYFPMFIAVLSLATSLFNGYLNNKFVDIIQHNVERIEYLKTCKEIIDSYFQVKFRASLLNNHRDNLGASDLAEAGN